MAHRCVQNGLEVLGSFNTGLLAVFSHPTLSKNVSCGREEWDMELGTYTADRAWPWWQEMGSEKAYQLHTLNGTGLLQKVIWTLALEM